MNYECNCECHTENVNCFDGCECSKCPSCGGNFTLIKEHYKECIYFLDWKKKQKRKLLRRMGILPPLVD